MREKLFFSSFDIIIDNVACVRTAFSTIKSTYYDIRKQCNQMFSGRATFEEERR